jgi:cysteinyl-tRNA synthetase
LLVVYNTLTRRKETFKPMHEGEVAMYVCGPTVYDSCHLGHARSVVAFDVIRRYLEYKGLHVHYIQNFTDIDDKMIQRAQERGVTVAQLAAKYIREYFEDFDLLGVKRATAFPRATEYIPDMIEAIQKLVKKGFAYEANGSVYFRVAKSKDYGKLSGQKADELHDAAEVAQAGEKGSAQDFALWKAMKPGEPFWDSPWGKGRPGWHIECSVMSTKQLGGPLDVHGGGMDLIFPHHVNEIAQAEALLGKRFARYWLHNGFLTLNREKMSKSLGNFFTIREVTAKYKPEVVRLFLISSHYRSPIDFSDQQLEEAKARLARIDNTIELLQRQLKTARDAETSTKVMLGSADQELWSTVAELRREFEEAMDDDFNTPVALASLNKFLSRANSLITAPTSATAGTLEEALTTLDAIDEVLGLYRQRMVQVAAPAPNQGVAQALIELLIELRNDARRRKDFAAADRIRTRLRELGILLEDEAKGTTWKWTQQ